jgi:DNA-binding MarR family transcriptional regulator
MMPEACCVSGADKARHRLSPLHCDKADIDRHTVARIERQRNPGTRASDPAFASRLKRKLTLRDLDTLMAVAQTGGMGKNRVRLGVSQPSVSKAIADLERSLGARLLDRSRRRTEPTAYGLAVVRRGFAMFDEWRGAVEDVDFHSDPDTVRFGSERRSRSPPRLSHRSSINSRDCFRE